MLIATGGCARRPELPPRPPIATSYPSPDYPPRDVTEATAPKPEARVATPVPPVSPPRTTPDRAPAVPLPSVAPAPATHRPSAPSEQSLPFAALDADHNGRVTLEEWRNAQNQLFRRLDTNDDSILTQEEVERQGPAPKRPQNRYPSP